jgi:hypothetical protein
MFGSALQELILSELIMVKSELNARWFLFGCIYVKVGPKVTNYSPLENNPKSGIYSPLWASFSIT